MTQKDPQNLLKQNKLFTDKKWKFYEDEIHKTRPAKATQRNWFYF